MALVNEVLNAAKRFCLETSYEWIVFPIDQMVADSSWRYRDETWPIALSRCHRVLLVADEESEDLPPEVAPALKQCAGRRQTLGGISAGIFPLARMGLLDGFRTAVHWRWLDDFSERFPHVIATNHLFEWDNERLTGCGGMATVDLLLAILNKDLGSEIAGAVSEELVVDRIREGSERQRIPLKNRLGSNHPKLTQAVLLMEANIEEPLTTDEIAQHVCVSRRQLERIFKQYLHRVPSQYYLELRLNKARQMLMQTSKSIIQIGLSCGFSSGPHFSSAYRNFFGVTPREDRNQRRSTVQEGIAVPMERS